MEADGKILDKLLRNFFLVMSFFLRFSYTLGIEGVFCIGFIQKFTYAGCKELHLVADYSADLSLEVRVKKGPFRPPFFWLRRGGEVKD